MVVFVIFKEVFASLGVLLFARLVSQSRASLFTYTRLSLHQLPSYWGTRNRSVGAGSTVLHTWWRATGSAAQRFQGKGSRLTQQIAFNTASAPRCVQAVQRVPNDRFLVPQYEGVRHTLYRPQRSDSVQNASTATPNPKRGHKL
jgi:hypothetical protein